MEDEQQIRKMLKSYYSVGSVLFSVSLTAIIGTLWQVGRTELPGVFEHHGAGLVISFLVTFGVAWVIPEPAGMADAGKRRLTGEEIFTSILSTFLNFAIVLGGMAAFTQPCGASMPAGPIPPDTTAATTGHGPRPT